MDGVDAPQFMSSQWHFATGAVIPPYGVAEITSVTAISVSGFTQPCVQLALPTENNPERIAFTGPTGIKSGSKGLCHAENTGYARYLGTFQAGERYGVRSGETSLRLDPDGDFISIGGSFSTSGGDVALFYKLRSEKFCGTVRFEIQSVDTATVPYSAYVYIRAKPCGCTLVPEDSGTGMLTVWDALQCLLYDESPEDLIGRRGFAHYMDIEPEYGLPLCRWEIASLCCP